MKTTQHFLRHALAAAAALALMAGSTSALAATTSICDADGGYVVAYHNDTMALPDDADAQRAALRIARHGRNTGAVETVTSETGKAEPVRYETFYSMTSSAQLQALATNYRGALGGALAQHWEYFWDFLGADTAAWSALAGKTGDSRFTGLAASFPAAVNSQKAAALAALKAALTDSTTLGNSQKARVQALYTERQKVTLASLGEQGALFADKGFAAIGAPTDKSMLRLPLGARPGADVSELSAKMAALVTPTNVENNKGFFTVTLSWSVPASEIGQRLNEKGVMADIENDFDLHVVEPTGTHVYYGLPARTTNGVATVARQGDAGYLDKDSQTVGPEHYYASCDEAVLKEGEYKIVATQEGMSKQEDSYLTLQVAFAKSGEVFSKTWNAKAAQASGAVGSFIDPTKSLTTPQITVKVTKLADGDWKASLVN